MCAAILALSAHANFVTFRQQRKKKCRKKLREEGEEDESCEERGLRATFQFTLWLFTEEVCRPPNACAAAYLNTSQMPGRARTGGLGWAGLHTEH